MNLPPVRDGVYRHVVVVECGGDPRQVSDALYRAERNMFVELMDSVKNPAMMVTGDKRLPGVDK